MNKTNNIAIDMIAAALRHYKRHSRTVKIVNLSSSYWKIFLVFMKRQNEELEIPDDGIQFNNVLIRKGHSFMKDALECILNPLIPVEQR